MTEKEQIIINGIDVSECPDFYISSANTRCCNCESDNTQFLPCKDNPNCYFKQLARKTQECEEYKKLAADFKDVNKQLGYKYLTIKKECEELKEYIQEREVWGDHCEFCKHNDKENCHQNIILDNLKTINSYRKALEEIEGLVKNFCKDCDDSENCDCEKEGCYYSLIPNLKDIINKVKEKSQ